MGIKSGQSRIELPAKALWAVVVLLLVLMLFKVAGLLVYAARAQGTVARTDRQEADADHLKETLAQARTSVEQLKKKNLFIMAAPKQHPVHEVLGILGSEVLINDKWYKVGESVEDARIVAVTPARVRISWDGQEREFSPMMAGEADGPPGKRVASGSRSTPEGAAPVVVSDASGGPRAEGRRVMSPQEREEERVRWQNLSPEERQRLREERRAKFGARRR